MRRLFLAAFVVACCVNFTGLASAATLTRGDVVYVRSNLRADGNTIFWHNMRLHKNLIPAGIEVKIVKCEGARISFTMPNGENTYRIVANANQWDKFFVKNKNEIGLDRLLSDTRAKVENCEVATGMTKEEVYISKGCPAYIAWGQKSEKNTLAEIMQSDKWYYMSNPRGHDVMVTFANGVVAKTGGFEK